MGVVRRLLLLALLRRKKSLSWHHSSSAGKKRLMALSGVLAKHKCSIRAKRRWWVRPLFQSHDEKGAWLNLIPELRLDEEKFYNFMRMTPEAFDSLLDMVEPFIKKKSWRKFIVPGERLAITLRYLATGDSSLSLSYLFRVSDQCISNILLETTTVIWHVLKDEVFPPTCQNTWLRTAAEFEAYWDFPHCIGAIDGRHIRVKASPHCGSRLFNYKRFHSLILLVVVDAKHRFLVVEGGASGRRGDGNVFHKSALGTRLAMNNLDIPPRCPVDGSDEDLPFVFVGDNAFQASEHMLTPFKGKFLDAPQRVYNYRVSRGRTMSENGLGVLVSRYGILQGTIYGSEAHAKSVLLATTALHNLHLISEDSIPPKKKLYCPEGFVDCMNKNGKVIRGRWRNECKVLEKQCLKYLQLELKAANTDVQPLSAAKVAELFMEYFIDNPVPWQWKKAHVL